MGTAQRHLAPVHGDRLSGADGALKDALAAYHCQFPLRRGMPREELRSRLRLEPRPFGQALVLWTRRGDAKEAAGAVALSAHEPRRLQ